MNTRRLVELVVLNAGYDLGILASRVCDDGDDDVRYDAYGGTITLSVISETAQWTNFKRLDATAQ